MFYLNRSPRGLLMGDAFTTRSTDDYSLFYNPALMGRNDGLSVRPFNLTLATTNALDDLDRFEDFPSSDPAAIANRIMGFPIFIQAGVAPSFKMGPFGFSLLANSQSSMVLRNRVHPILSVNHRYDRGFIFGAAFSKGTGAKASIWDGRKAVRKKKTTAGTRASAGFSIKKINREGIQGDFDIFGTSLYSKIINGVEDASDIKEALGYSKGEAWGLDLGADFVRSSGAMEFGVGLSILDVGDTQFKKTEGSADIPLQEMVVATGTHFGIDFGIGEFVTSFDLHPINQGHDFLRMSHFGVELTLPFISLMSGFNSGYLSYGVELNLWLIRIVAGFYGVELSRGYKVDEGKRAVLYISLFDLSFDS
ncbi:MAG: hypothetical protein ACPGJV_13765 [Bacteriovoracaceae bacterium]